MSLIQLEIQCGRYGTQITYNNAQFKQKKKWNREGADSADWFFFSLVGIATGKQFATESPAQGEGEIIRSIRRNCQGG